MTTIDDVLGNNYFKNYELPLNYSESPSLYAYKDPFLTLRNENSVIKRIAVSGALTSKKNTRRINRNMEKFGIFMEGSTPEKNKSSYDFAFESAKFPKYTNDKGENISANLLKIDFPNIRDSEYPKVGNIVAYTGSENLFKKNPVVDHWGVVLEANNKIIIESKWGENIYSHPLDSIPIEFGSQVYFFEKY